MKAMYRLLFYLAGLISLTSCYGITDFQKSINDAKLCGATTGLESKIYLNGIYVSEDSTDSNNPEWKSSLIFYPDGSFIVIDVNMGRGKDFLENLNTAIKKAGYNKRKARWNWEFGTLPKISLLSV